MRRVVLWALVFCVVAQFGGCKSSTVSEVALAAPPQTKLWDSRCSRDYIFLREKGLVGTEVGIRARWQAGRFGSHGVLFLFRKTAGTVPHSLRQFDLDGFMKLSRFEGGKTYYFGIGTPQVAAPGQNLLNQALAGSSGQQMRPTSALMGGFSGSALYQIDAAEGPAVILVS